MCYDFNMQQILITIEWPWLLGIFGTIVALAWGASGKFSKIETLLETMDKRLTGIERKLEKVEIEVQGKTGH